MKTHSIKENTKQKRMRKKKWKEKFVHKSVRSESLNVTETNHSVYVDLNYSISSFSSSSSVYYYKHKNKKMF